MKLLVMPGLGDIHWVMLKVQSFAKSKSATRIDVSIWNSDGKPRSIDYVRLLPFVDSCHYYNYPYSREKSKWHNAVHGDRCDLQDGFDGHDYVMSFNGSLRYGRNIITEIMPDCPCDFSYPVPLPMQAAEFADLFHRQHGDYILYYFNNLLMYAQSWLRHFKLSDIVALITKMRDAMPNRKAVLTGVSWDAPYVKRIRQHLPDADWVVDMTERTSLPQLFALNRRATAFIGWCAGNTIMSTHLGTPTVMLWSDYFQSRNFATCWADPAKINRSYVPLFVEDTNPDQVVDAARSAVKCPQ
jgi:hypothetical protein